jgi:hypothetical protein
VAFGGGRRQCWGTTDVGSNWRTAAGYKNMKQAGDRNGMKEWQDLARQNFETLMAAPPERVVISSSTLEIK